MKKITDDAQLIVGNWYWARMHGSEQPLQLYEVQEDHDMREWVRYIGTASFRVCCGLPDATPASVTLDIYGPVHAPTVQECVTMDMLSQSE